MTNPLRDRFGIVARLEFYGQDDLTTIVRRSSQLLNIEIENQGASEIACRSRGTPRIANRLLRRVRDYAQVKADGRISKPVADAALKMLESSARDGPHGLNCVAVIRNFPAARRRRTSRTCSRGTETIEDVSALSIQFVYCSARRAFEWLHSAHTVTSSLWHRRVRDSQLRRET